jgi:hypothetical protein
MYADDVSLLLKHKITSNLEIEPFLKLIRVYQYLNNNNLHVNPDKTTCLHFSSHKITSSDPIIVMIDFELSFSSDSKYLGLTCHGQSTSMCFEKKYHHYLKI